LQRENEELRQQLSKLVNQARQPSQKVVHIDYQKVRLPLQALRSAQSLVLNKLKVGSQSAAGKALDLFIKELEKQTE
jgi:phage tail tape-measure protein